MTMPMIPFHRRRPDIPTCISPDIQVMLGAMRRTSNRSSHISRSPKVLQDLIRDVLYRQRIVQITQVAP